MSFTKHWTHEGRKEMIRNHDEAEWQRTAHQTGQCDDDCPHCKATRHVFDRLHTDFLSTFKKWMGPRP